MRSYAQYCPLAMGLDIVGDRWTLLIVRELGIRSARYSDLHEALPGIATNLLADRLRTLTEAGVLELTITPPPAVANVYALTDWGRQLYDIVVRLGRWGARTLSDGSAGRMFRARYTIPVLHALYSIDADLEGLEPLTVRIDHDEEHVHISVDADGVTASIDDDQNPVADVTIDGPPETILGLLAGVLDPRDHAGAGFRGDRTAIRRFRSWTSRAVLTS